MNNELHFSSKSDDWATPQGLFDELNAAFKFDWDVCASADNAKCDRFYTREQNGLAHPWVGTCWMNPPYGRQIGEWIAKAAVSALHGARVVCLLPARTDTRWWHEHIWDRETHQPRPGVRVMFVKGRIKFGGATAGAPFPSVIVEFKPGLQDAGPA